MSITKKISAALLLAGCLSLAGCADWIDFDAMRAAGFVAPRPLHHRLAAKAQSPAPAAAVVPASASAPDTELSKCNQQLYLHSHGSQDDIHAMEAKCRTVILNQPY